MRHTSLTYAAYATPVRIGFGENRDVRMHFCLGGAAEIRAGGVPLLSTAQDCCVIPANAPTDLHLGRGYRTLTVRLDSDALARKLAAMLGYAPAGALSFDAAMMPRDSAFEKVRRAVCFVADELDASGPDHLLMAELEQLMMVYFLRGCRHSHRHLLERPAADAAPRQVRRAEDFIDANLNQPITVEAIADATGVSARSIFKGFRDSRGCSPMEFVKSRRLERAHEMLRAAEPGVTVTGVALSCGFANTGHFARNYRGRFGELPSETLARTLGLAE
jgi:AraC-like DNA-binding protein